MTSTGIHDIGGLEEEFGPIDLREHGYQLWEMQVVPPVLPACDRAVCQTHGLLALLFRQGHVTTDQLRRGVEALPGHREMSYYHRCAARGVGHWPLKHHALKKSEIFTIC